MARVGHKNGLSGHVGHRVRHKISDPPAASAREAKDACEHELALLETLSAWSPTDRYARGRVERLIISDAC